MDEVSEVVGEFSGISGGVFVPGKVRVGEGVDVAKEKVAEGFETVAVDSFERVNDIAERFGHFLAVGENVSVRNDGFRKRKTETKKNGWPNDSVKTKNVLADKLDVGGPKVGDVGLGIAKDSEIVSERVNPDIHNLVVVAGDGYAPGEVSTGTRDGDVRGGFEKI